eukprot:gene20133-30942_t
MVRDGKTRPAGDVVTLYDKGLTSMFEIAALRTGRVACLNLHMNGISAVENVAAAAGTLTELDLSSNALRSLAGLACLRGLRHLNVSANALDSLPDTAFQALPQLERLVASYNNISDLAPLRHLRSLTELRLEGNAVSDVGQLSALRSAAGLRTLCFRVPDSRQPACFRSANPVCGDGGYLAAVARCCAAVRWLDGQALYTEPADARRVPAGQGQGGPEALGGEEGEEGAGLDSSWEEFATVAGSSDDAASSSRGAESSASEGGRGRPE